MNIQRGNPYSALLTFTDSTGGPYDLTDKTVLFALKLAADVADNDNSAVATAALTAHADATGGLTVLTLTEDETLALSEQREGYYKADFRIYKLDTVQANTEMIYPLIKDIVTKRKS